MLQNQWNHSKKQKVYKVYCVYETCSVCPVKLLTVCCLQTITDTRV